MSFLQMIPGVGSLDDVARGELGNLSDDRSNLKMVNMISEKFWCVVC